MLNAKKVNESAATPFPLPAEAPSPAIPLFPSPSLPPPFPYCLLNPLLSLLPRVSATNRTWMCNLQCGKRMRACGMWRVASGFVHWAWTGLPLQLAQFTGYLHNYCIVIVHSLWQLAR